MMRNKGHHIWYEELQKKGFNLGRVDYLVKEKLIQGNGNFALTIKGTDMLNQQLSNRIKFREAKKTKREVFFGYKYLSYSY